MIKAIVFLLALGGIAALLMMRQRMADAELGAEFEAAPSWPSHASSNGTSQEPVAASETPAS